MTEAHSHSLDNLFLNIWNDCFPGSQTPSLASCLICLSGAPGAGKGTHLPLILKTYKLHSQAYIGMSDLFNTPEFKKIKDSGVLIDDATAISLLVKKLSEATFQEGVVIDGFPRTLLQADFLKWLAKKLLELHHTDPTRYPKPVFELVVLDVNEANSIERQAKRGEEAKQKYPNNARATDTCIESARKRYNIFKTITLPAFKSLENHFSYHHIDASGSISDVQQKIINIKTS